MKTNDQKVIAIAKLTAGTDIDANQLATLLSLMGKLDREDVLKVMWSSIGAASALQTVNYTNSRKDVLNEKS